MYLAMDQYEEALAAFDHALQLDATQSFTWSNKAMALRALGREWEAQEADQQAELRQNRSESAPRGPADG